MRRWISVLKDTVSEWSDDDVPRHAAALSYYMLLSLAPLSLLCVAIVGFVFGDDAARGQVAAQVGTVTGPQAAEAVQSVILHSRNTQTGVVSSIIGIVLLLLGASGVFGQLQTALNIMWGVKPKPGRGVWGFIRDRFFSFTMVLAVGFMLLVSLLISAGLAALGRWMANWLPGGEVFGHILNFVISFGVITVLFVLIFKVVPDARIRWRDAFVGGAITALLFTLGKFALGLYLGKSSVTSGFGAAGSIVAFVVWVYYASQILFLGAEFTQVYSRVLGEPISPADNAIPADQNSRLSPQS